MPLLLKAISFNKNDFNERKEYIRRKEGVKSMFQDKDISELDIKKKRNLTSHISVKSID